MDPTLGDGAAFFNTTNNLEEYFSVADARAFDALGWDWLFSSVALDDFNLVSPPDGASIFALTPILDWSIATNATNYNVQLYFLAADYNSAEWVLLDEADTGVGTSYDVPSGLLERGRTYRWDVVAESPAGKRWSDVWYFTVAQLVPVPAPSPFLITNPPVSIDIAARNTAFTWELVDPELVSMYLVEIDTQATFQSPDLIKLAVFPPYPAPGEPLTELPPGLLRSGESYFCRVRAINGTGETFAGPVAAANFTVGSFPPEPFGLLYPGPGDRTPRDPRLQWQAAHDADNYDVEVASDSDFNDQVFSALEITGTDVKLPHGTLAPDTEYFWRARARNNAGTTRAEPLVQAFRTLPPRPGPFTLLDPPDDVILVSAAPILSFTGVTDPGGYFVVVDDDPDEGLSEVFAHTTDEFLALDPLPRGRLYHWSVTAYNAGGTRSGTPESSRFFIAAGDFDFNQDGARDLRDVAAYQRCYSVR
jgi:hypothetical protein